MYQLKEENEEDYLEDGDKCNELQRPKERRLSRQSTVEVEKWKTVEATDRSLACFYCPPYDLYHLPSSVEVELMCSQQLPDSELALFLSMFPDTILSKSIFFLKFARFGGKLFTLNLR